MSTGTVSEQEGMEAEELRTVCENLWQRYVCLPSIFCIFRSPSVGVRAVLHR